MAEEVPGTVTSSVTRGTRTGVEGASERKPRGTTVAGVAVDCNIVVRRYGVGRRVVETRPLYSCESQASAKAHGFQVNFVLTPKRRAARFFARKWREIRLSAPAPRPERLRGPRGP